MARYRKLPAEIEAEEFTGAAIDCVSIVGPLGYNEVYNKLHDSWIKLKVGDFVRTDLAPDDVYPIDREVFFNTYELVEEKI